MHARSLAARAKKRASKENSAGQGNGDESMDVGVDAGVNIEQQIAVPESDAGVSSEQQTTLSTPAESSEQGDTNNMASAGDGENLSESNAGNENVKGKLDLKQVSRLLQALVGIIMSLTIKGCGGFSSEW